jgi:hypothetical protein
MEDDMKTKTPRRKKPAPLTLREMTIFWNEQIPEALRLGLTGVKVHTSPFESRAAGEKRLAWLTAEMKKARRRLPRRLPRG